MPDDVTTEVTEQVPETPAPDLPADEASGFASKKGDDIDENIEGLEPESIVPEKKPTKRDSKKAAVSQEASTDLTETLGEDAETEKEPEEEAEADGETDETDEDVARGKELVAEQEKAEEDRKAAEESQKVEKIEAGGYSPFHEKQNAEGIEFFKGVIPQGLFPDTVTLKDGTELDFKGLMANEPEIPVMVAVIANNLIRQMISNKYLATRADIEDVNNNIDNRLFVRTVTNRNDGVPNAQKIYNDAAFKKWGAEQPKEIQALMKSSDPYDHIRVFKRYLGQAGLDGAKGKVVELDEKRKAAKGNIDGVLKNTIRSKSAKPKAPALSQREEEAAGFNSKDDENDYL